MFGGSTLSENSIKYLFYLSNELPRWESSRLLKSYYLMKVHRLAFKEGTSLPQSYTKTSRKCPYCSVPFGDENPSYVIQPERKQNGFVRKLLNKGKHDLPLTRYQQRFLQKLKRKQNEEPHNKLVIKCNVCQKQTINKLPKPKIVPVIPKTLPFTPRKKKKKKDLFIGLNREAVLLATPQNKLNDSSRCKILPKTPVITQSEETGSKIKQSSSTKLPSKHRQKQNKQALLNLKNILGTNKKSQGSNMLKQFLTSI